jgi:hypothetical protein
MSEVQRPFIRLIVPLSRGAVEPVDASAFRGLRFEVQGAGTYRLLILTRGVRNADYYQTSFNGTQQWTTVNIDFAQLKQESKIPTQWTGQDLLMVMFEVARKPGETAVLELDNLQFYK